MNVADTITLVAWSALAAAALVVLARLPADRRGAWYVVAIYCAVVAVDKAVDVQVALYRLVQFGVHGAQRLLEPWLDLRGHRALLRLALLVPGLVVTVTGTVWLVRRDRQLDRGKRLACTGLVLVLLLVGVRLLPGVAAWIDERVGWVVEGLAIGLLAAGLRHGWCSSPPDQGRATPVSGA